MAVNPNILSVTGLNFEGLVFATAFSSFVATMIMALWANLPFGLWPGMGMNAYFAYTIVGFKGSQQPAKKVMFCVFIEGILFIVLSLLDFRRFAIKVFPTWMMKATMAGIGCFLAFIGLQNGNGINIIQDHPAILVDMVTLNSEHFARTWLGIIFFCIMASLVLMRVRGAVMIGILVSTFFCWILEASGSPQFTYEPMCCLGEVTYPVPLPDFPETMGYFPKPGGGWMPKPTCVNPFEVPGETVWEGEGDDKMQVWKGASVSTNGTQHTIIDGGKTTFHTGSLLFKGNAGGRDSTFKGGCDDGCHSMYGGFNPACFGSTLVSTGCWPGLSYQDRAAQQVLVDGFGEGCLGGAGRIPKTYKAPTSIASAPLAEKAGDIVEPWPGFFGCNYNDAGELLGCWAGDIDGGTIMAFDTEDLNWENFGKPLLTLFYVDFLGTMGFLYAAADLSGLIDPANPDTFPGCYAAFMADAVGTAFGGFLGTSSVTTYGESMAGVYEGGRTGLTALVIAFFNFICMFLAPFFSAIPTISTGPALVMVGVFMIEGVKDIDWTDYMQAIPSLVCILLQITTYKIEVGILGALFVWAFMMVCSLRFLAYIPGCYKGLPKGLQDFIANQPGDAAFKKRIAFLNGESPEEAKAGAA
eukprot:gnl/MRDRNA2_/MRDRNA2_84715_c1_seq1.p1 gnl/MRDRNA2_/MRDRNA2_84715_c1~~gnl/MRDRNA2_/MRDRNA2_84715_c1_seq1.p1  ORF type:complete len:731 (+),score=131.02 gnl/MRDRNA2_/MRDRNA2_84715_c1_seq1:279-2195(+)